MNLEKLKDNDKIEYPTLAVYMHPAENLHKTAVK